MKENLIKLQSVRLDYKKRDGTGRDGRVILPGVCEENKRYYTKERESMAGQGAYIHN